MNQEQLEKMTAETAKNWYELGVSQELNGDRDSALYSYRKACALIPDNRNYFDAERRVANYLTINQWGGNR